MLRQAAATITADTRGRGLFEITSDICGWVADTGICDGVLTLFLRHTSAGLLIRENADPDVRGDLDRFLGRLVQDGDLLLRHRDEGPDDMPAHVRYALKAVQLSIPVSQGPPAGFLAIRDCRRSMHPRICRPHWWSKSVSCWSTSNRRRKNNDAHC